MMPRVPVLLALTLCLSLESSVTAFATPAIRTAPCSTAAAAAATTTTKTSLYSSSTDNEEVTKLLEKAAQIRAEIAAMEGKTLEQVESEAREKKDAARMRADADEAKRKEQKADNTNYNNRRDDGRFLDVPSTPDDMVRQAARSVERAFQDGINRQTVRFALIREDQYVNDMNEWPGGAQQMSRESAKPLTKELLRQIRAATKQKTSDDEDNNDSNNSVDDLRLPPTIKEQDIWDFDGSALITAEARAGANGDVQAMVLPNTDTKYTNDIDTIDKAMGKRLFLLINPFWRNLDSWGINLLAPGAKKKAEEIIFNRGYNDTYSLLRFSCRGEECVALKAYPYDWQIYAYREDDHTNMETTIRLGSCKEEPSSEFVTKLINERPEFKDTRTMRKLRKNF